MLRKAVVVACLTVFAAMTLSAPMTAAQIAAHTNYISVSKPIRLPGVVLPAGKYIFELPDPIGAWDVVNVMSADRHRVYYSGLTKHVARPNGLPESQILSFAESRPDAAAPIRIWWPVGEKDGREFSYPANQ